MGGHDSEEILKEIFSCIDNISENQTEHGSRLTDSLVKFEEILHKFWNGTRNINKNNLEEVDASDESKKRLVELKKTLSTQVGPNGQTIMQLLAEKGLHEFIAILLNEGVDPNYPKNLDSHRGDEMLPPVLLAAKYGHSQILQEFKKHNYNYKTSSSLVVIDELHNEDINSNSSNSSYKRNVQIEGIGLKSMDINDIATSVDKTPCNFSVTSTRGETILHLILKENDLKQLSSLDTQQQGSGTLKSKFPTHESYAAFKKEKGDKRSKIRKKYEKCLDVVLGSENVSLLHVEQMR